MLESNSVEFRVTGVRFVGQAVFRGSVVMVGAWRVTLRCQETLARVDGYGLVE